MFKFIINYNMAFRKKTYRRKAPKRTYKRKSYAKKVSKPIKTAIRREIARNTENKKSQYYSNQRTLVTPIDSALFNTSNIIPLGPDPASVVISQGTGQGQRVGNEIKTKKLVFRGTLFPMPQDANFNSIPRPMMVKMWIFYDKTDPTAVPSPVNNFFQNGNTQRSLQSNLTDMWAPVNTDRYRVLTTKMFKLGTASYDGSSLQPGQQFYANNDFKYNCTFSMDLTKHYIQRVKFNDASTVPTTRGLYCMFEYVSANGGVWPIGTTAAAVTYMQDYEYEDA